MARCIIGLCMCGALCVEPVLEVEGEREEKKWMLESPGKLSLAVRKK